MNPYAEFSEWCSDNNVSTWVETRIKSYLEEENMAKVMWKVANDPRFAKCIRLLGATANVPVEGYEHPLGIKLLTHLISGETQKSMNVKHLQGNDASANRIIPPINYTILTQTVKSGKNSYASVRVYQTKDEELELRHCHFARLQKYVYEYYFSVGKNRVGKKDPSTMLHIINEHPDVLEVIFAIPLTIYKANSLSRISNITKFLYCCPLNKNIPTIENEYERIFFLKCLYYSLAFRSRYNLTVNSGGLISITTERTLKNLKKNLNGTSKVEGIQEHRILGGHYNSGFHTRNPVVFEIDPNFFNKEL